MKTPFNIEIGEVNNIGDLLKITEKYKFNSKYYYNINLKALHNIKDDLKMLNDMIGLSSLKSSILDQLLYFIQNLHLTPKKNILIKSNVQPKIEYPQTSLLHYYIPPPSSMSINITPPPPLPFPSFNTENNDLTKIDEGDFKHTVIYGPPGTGKTEVAKILGKIYSKMGILKKNFFKKVTRSDLIGQFLGQTAQKTRAVINECLGGVLFIDEAYSLGSSNGGNDIYSQECIDVLCEALSAHKNDLMVIIAGYENELEEKFFRLNQGLNSRFIWRYHIEKYNCDELIEIFKKKIKDIEWSISEMDLKKWFEPKMKYFTNYGRDMENLLLSIKISHSRRIFGKPQAERKIIKLEDMNKGFKKFCENPEVMKRGIERNASLLNLYV
jgi:hypothetical protein